MSLSIKSYSNIYLRIFVILLCCVLVFQLCSVEAHAAAITASAVSIALSLAIGLGVTYFANSAESESIFLDMADRIAYVWENRGMLVNGEVPLFVRNNKYYVAPEFVDVAFWDMVDIGAFVAIPSLTFSSSHSFSVSTYEYDITGGNVAVVLNTYWNSTNGRYEHNAYAISTDSSSVYSNGRKLSVTKTIGNYKLYLLYGGSGNIPYSGITQLYSGSFSDGSSANSFFYASVSNSDFIAGSVTSDYPLDVSGVANYANAPEASLEQLYPAWSIAMNDDATTPGFSVIVKPNVDDYLSVTQSQVHAGQLVTDIPGTGEGTDTGTIAGWLENIWTGIQALPQSIATSVTDALSSKIQPEELELNLTEFFPFCIPFDIYEFFSILAADPVAPVFEWTIPVPQLGTSYDFEVDLSAWDPVAQLFRTLELLAFCVGLAFFTRDKFTRG